MSNQFNQLKKNVKELAAKLGLQKEYKATGSKSDLLQKYAELQIIDLNREFGFGYDIDAIIQRQRFEFLEDVL